MTDNLKDLIMKLLSRDASDRLGSKKDVIEIIQHPWFEEIDFEKLCKKELEAPYKPAKSQLTFKEEDLPELRSMKNIGANGEPDDDDIPDQKKKLILENQDKFDKF